MFRRTMPLVMLVMIAILAVVFCTGREGQFAAAASRLPDEVLYHAQTLRSEMQGKVVILQDFVAVEDEVEEEPVVLKAGVPAEDGAPATDAGAAPDVRPATAPADGGAADG